MGKLIGVQGRVDNLNFARRSLSGTALVVVLALSSPGPSRADDVTTLSGQTFHDVRVVHVDPDGVTWQHATGMAKVDFTDLPEPVRRAFHYDAGKAKAYQDAQAQVRQQADAQAQQDKRNLDARRAQRFHEQSAATAGEADAAPGFTFHPGHDRAVEIVAQAIGEQTEARKAAQAKLTEYDGTIWDRRIWAIPSLFLGHSDGHLFDRPVPKVSFDIDPKLMAPSWAERVKADIGY